VDSPLRSCFCEVDLSIFMEGALVMVRIPVDGHSWWREPKTGIVVGAAEEDPWDFGDDDKLPHRYVPVIVDGRIMRFRENKIKFVSRSQT